MRRKKAPLAHVHSCSPSGTIFLVSYRSSRLQEVLKETYGHTNYPSFTRECIRRGVALSCTVSADTLS